MPRAELTLHIDGDVEIDDFVYRVQHFDKVVHRLVRELKMPRREWIITDLDAGSATTTIGATYDSVDLVEFIQSNYLTLGRTAGDNDGVISRFSKSLIKDTRAIAVGRIGRAHDVKFSVGLDEVSIVPESEKLNLPENVVAHGEIRGRAETASIHNREYFTVYESIYGWPVRCYPQTADLDNLRKTLGMTVVVSGRVKRNLETGRPIDVHEALVVPAQVVEPGAWRQAVGLVPVGPEGLSAEEAIRRFRDA